MENNEIKATKKETKVEALENKLFLERAKFKGSDGKEYWSYYLKGQVRNREVRVDFAPKDKGGYEPLDIVFEVTDKPELVMTDEVMTDNNGHEAKYKAYRVTATENGVEYACSVKPSRDSDKSLLTMLLNQIKAKASK